MTAELITEHCDINRGYQCLGDSCDDVEIKVYCKCSPTTTKTITTTTEPKGCEIGMESGDLKFLAFNYF